MSEMEIIEDDNDDMAQTLPDAAPAEKGKKKKKKKKKKKAAPMVEETDNPLFPMGESNEKGDGRLDGLESGTKDELNQGLSQLQDFVATSQKTEEEEGVGECARRSILRATAPCHPLTLSCVFAFLRRRGGGDTAAEEAAGGDDLPRDAGLVHCVWTLEHLDRVHDGAPDVRSVCTPFHILMLLSLAPLLHTGATGTTTQCMLSC